MVETIIGCECGWQGKVDDMVADFSFERFCCPKCNQPLVSFQMAPPECMVEAAMEAGVVKMVGGSGSM